MSAQTKSKVKNLNRVLVMILFVLFITVFNFYNVGNAKEKTTGHLLWDGIDQVFRCVGSPINCAF